MHCALAALLDEDPEGCFFVAEKRGKLFKRITLPVEDNPDFITITPKPVALCAAPHILPPVFFAYLDFTIFITVSHLRQFHEIRTFVS